jgi:DNA polymerase-3 subunit alpha
MFVNCHNHSNFSHDCISRIPDIVEFAKTNNQTAIALTDHGNISGCVEFYRECKKRGIKPILGNELYICQPSKSASLKDSSNKTLNHLVVLAKNMAGFKNLLKLTKLSNQNFYYRPRVDEDMLFAHKEGLIVLNGHIGTSLFDCLFFNFKGVETCSSIDEARLYLYDDYEERCLNLINRYVEQFGDDFYVEIQLFDKGDICQQSIGTILYEVAKKYNLKAIGTGDSHYIESKDAVLHKTFCAIKQNAKIKDLPPIGYFTSGKYGLLDNEWAESCYSADLIEVTNEVANKIEDYDILKPHAIPKFDIENPRQHIYNRCIDRLKELDLHNKVYLDRLDSELAILELGNLYDYFLIVADYVNWAKSNGILVGPSRGSAGGCLISYLLQIISIDPLKYNLLMDRFYSEDRAANKILPDIDSDFPATRREEVIAYIRHKYGADKVAGAVTFSTLQGKNALKDVLRVHSVCDFQQMNKITELIPARDKISDKLAEFKDEVEEYGDSIINYCLHKEPDLLKDYCYLEDGVLKGDYADYFKIAIGLEGAIKSESKHASALIISSNPIEEVAPLLRDKSSDELIVALDMDSFEAVSLVKFDILGIKSLDCLSEVNKLLEEIGIV